MNASTKKPKQEKSANPIRVELLDGKEKIALPAEIFALPSRPTLVQQLISVYLHNLRTFTSRQKTRGEVRGGGRKPWRQKHTGRARAGSRRSPIWRGGGVSFASRSLGRKLNLNSKMYRLGFRTLLSELAREGRIRASRRISIKQAKSKSLKELIGKWKLESSEKVLIVLAEADEKLVRAASNLPRLEAVEVGKLNPHQLASCDRLVIAEDALKPLKKRLIEGSGKASLTGEK